MRRRKSTNINTSIVPISVQNKLSKKTDSGIEKEIMRIADFYLLHLKQVRLSQERGFGGLAERTLLISSLLLSAAKDNTFVDLTSLKKVEDVHDVLRRVSGFTEIYTWLNSQAETKKILLESGKQNQFLMLWHFKMDLVSYKSFKDLDTYRKEVRDLGVWLKIVALFINRDKSKVAFMKPSKEVKNWNMGAIFISFLISITLETEKSMFTLSDMYDFLRKVDHFDVWKKEVEGKIYGGFEKDSGAKELYEHELMREILRDLEQPKNRVVFYFSGRLVFTAADKKLIVAARKVFDKAVASKTSEELSLITEEGKNAKAKERITRLVSRKKIEFVYECLACQKYYLDWLNDSELMRVIAYDNVTDNKGILDYAKEHSLASIELLANLSRSFTMAEILSQVWKEKEPFNMSWAYLTSNRCTNIRPCGEKFRLKFFHDINMEVISYLGYKGYMLWLGKVESEGFVPKQETISDFAAIVMHFMFNKNELPKCVRQKIESFVWYRFIDDEYAKVAFESRVASRVKKRS